MAINIKFNELGIFGIIVGAAGTIIGGILLKKGNDIAKKLDRSIEDLDKNTVVDIQQNLIEKATEQAVERQVSGAVKKAIENVSSQIRSDMDSMIRKDVDCVYSDMKDNIQERVSEEIDSIDYDELRNDIRRKAERKVLDEVMSFSGIGQVFSGVRNVANGDLGGISDILSQFDSDWDRTQALKTLLAKR